MSRFTSDYINQYLWVTKTNLSQTNFENYYSPCMRIKFGCQEKYTIPLPLVFQSTTCVFCHPCDLDPSRDPGLSLDPYLCLCGPFYPCLGLCPYIHYKLPQFFKLRLIFCDLKNQCNNFWVDGGKTASCVMSLWHQWSKMPEVALCLSSTFPLFFCWHNMTYS